MTVAGLSVKLLRSGEAMVRVAATELPAVSRALVFTGTGVVDTGEVTLVAPAGMTTLLEIFADVVLEVTCTLSPPVGAGPVREMVAVTLVPPITEAGLTVKDLRAGGLTVSVVVCFPAAVLAEIVATTALATGIVLIAKVAVVFVAATVADAGTVATELVLPSFTTSPPVGAADERIIVPFEPDPPRMLAGETVT